MNETERMKKLVKKLNEAAKAYYQEDREIMSNQEYDDLYDQPRRFGRHRAECRGQSEKGEEIAEFHHSIY